MSTANCARTLRLALLSSVVAALPAAAQDRETRALTGFNGVAVGGGIELSLRQGEPFNVEVVADDGELDEIVTEVRNGKLEIRRRRSSWWFNWGDAGSVNVTMPTLVSLTASGGSDVRSEGTFTSDTVELVASGGSDVTLDVAAGSLEVTASGGSDVRLSGSARSARVQTSGGSDLDARAFTADDADVQSSGGSDLAIGVRNRIVGNASGGSDIRYTGQPSVVQVNSSGGGAVLGR
jgi:hypothetical protein